jgi:hypothetical protein
MLVFLPTTLPALARVRAAGKVELPDGFPVHAVTPDVREWYTEGDLEELEYTVLCDAALSSLRRLAEDLSAPRRRAVLVARLGDDVVHPVNGSVRSLVTVDGPVALDCVISVYLDEAEAEGAVGRAVEALPAADAGDDDAAFLLDEAVAHELVWYDVTEIPHLV